MQNNIKKLQSEVSHLKQTNMELVGKLNGCSSETNANKHSDSEHANNDNSGSRTQAQEQKRTEFNAYYQHQHQVDRDQSNKNDKNMPKTMDDFDRPKISSLDIDQMQKLLSSIHKLEQKIVAERTEHLEQMEKLQTENSYLRDKVRVHKYVHKDYRVASKGVS
jgi:hypothetical protein